MASDGQRILLTTEELAEYLHLSPRTIEDWRSDGKGPDYIKMGTGKSARVLYKWTEVQLWISRMETAQRQ